LRKRARQDSNLQPLVPKTSALSIELRTRSLFLSYFLLLSRLIFEVDTRFDTY
jgi:hypothetical protein